MTAEQVFAISNSIALVHGEFLLKRQSAFGITRYSASAIDKI
jgi:hypothetical protein